MRGEQDAGLDATGIAVELFDPRAEPRRLRWVLPLGGGRAAREDGLSIEVNPQVEVPRDRWRDHEEIERLAGETERMGGFMRSGDAIEIGDEKLVGRDSIELLVVLARRAHERAGDPGAEYKQGYRDALRDLRAASEGLDRRSA